MNKKNIYKVSHQYSVNDDETCVFIESELRPIEFATLIGTIHMKFEDVVSSLLTMEESHLTSILENFFGAKNVTEQYQMYLPYTQLDKSKWAVIDRFTISEKYQEVISEVFVINQIDWFAARECACGNADKLIKELLPDTEDFNSAINNRSLYESQLESLQLTI